MTRLLPILFALAACGASPPKHAPQTPEATLAMPATQPVATPPPQVMIRLTEQLTTRDGVALEADLYLAPSGAPAVVLLHMIPPHFERSSWPVPFIEGLVASGWSVVVVDRRGSGASEGEPKQAYEGEWGRYDVEAAVKRLSAHGVRSFALIGASNGTTSMIDYAVWAKAEGLPVPAFLGFMTGGNYTENQTDMAAVASFPAAFTYSTEEREWSAAQQARAAHWTFHEYPDGAHGTKMFGVQAQVADDLIGALAKALSK